MQLYPIGSARQQLVAHLSTLRLATRRRAENDRLAMREARAKGDRQADLILKDRKAQARIYATLFRIAAVEGSSVADPAEAIKRHGKTDLTDFEIDKIHHRLERGFAAEAYRPGSRVANVPDMPLLDGAVLEEGVLSDDALRDICAMLAARRAEIESEAERLYAKALSDPEKPLVVGEPIVSFNESSSWACPAYQSADRFSQDDVTIAITDTGDLLVSPATEHAPASIEPSISPSKPVPAPAPIILPVPTAAEEANPIAELPSSGKIDELVEDLIITGTWGEKTAKQVRGVAHLFQRVTNSRGTEALNEKSLIKYRATLDKLPRDYGKSPKDFEGTLDDVIERAKKNKKPTGLTKRTINRHLTNLSAIYRFGFSMDLCRDWSNLINSRRPKVTKKDKKKGIPFLPEHAKEIFSCVEWSRRPVLPEASLYWGVLLAAYTGARQSEIAGLKVADIDAQARVIHIRPNKNREVKTEAGERDIPIHKELVRLGFLTYLRRVRACLGDEADLFPDLRARGLVTSHGALLAKSFDKIMERSGLKEKVPDLNFHSWRHGVNTKMATVTDAIREGILGHEGQTVNLSVYMHDIEPEVLATAIGALDWPTKSLESLAWSRWNPPVPARMRKPRQRRPTVI